MLRRRPGIWDALALLVLAGYALLARSTVGGGGADAVWQAAQARGELVVGTDAGYRPFADERGGQFTGYDVELMQELGRRLGLRVRFVNIGYDALYDALSGGQADVIAAGLALTPEQGWRARFSDPYLDGGLQLMAPLGSPIARREDLAGRRVAVALGSTADVEARRLSRSLPGLTIVSTPLTPAEALETVRRGEADAAIVDGPAAITALNTSQDLRAVEGLTYEPFVLAVPVGAYKLHAELNLALAALRREGYFERLNAKWFR